MKRLGKSMVGLALKQIYGENAIVVGPKQLKGEITSGEQRVDADYMKYIITSPTVTINEKNKAIRWLGRWFRCLWTGHSYVKMGAIRCGPPSYKMRFDEYCVRCERKFVTYA